jgi:hypothetical protein
MIESRQEALNRADVELITATRHDLPKGTRLRVDHRRGATEPLFWVADIVAGAIRAGREGHSTYHQALGRLVDVIEVPC